jgi:flagellar motor component MotA
MMEVGTLAGVVTAVATLITAFGGLLLAIKVIMPTHKIVNQQRTDMHRFQTVLIRTLIAHGIDVPEDQSRLD